MLWDGNGLVGKRVETVREPGPNRPRLISANPDYTPITRRISATRRSPCCGGIDKQDDNPWVIAGRKPGSHLTDLQHPWRRIRARAGLNDWRIHDLRHSFASGGLLVGEGLPMIGKLLGHTQVQTTARYAHLANDPVKSAANRIASRIAEVAG